MSVLPRLLLGIRGDGPLSAAEHEAVHGPAPRRGPGLIDELERAGLRGRGGASFPTAIKMRGVSRQPGKPIVLVNGAEGEPLSHKDRVLLASTPHLVLDGALAAAEAVGARDIVIAVREDGVAALAALRSAIGERSLQRSVTVTPVPVAYLAGEESALIRHLNGGPLKPTVVPPRPFERGLGGRPTLVQNPETLAHLALIARHGAAWFREAGTVAHPGSALATVTGAVRDPGVLEIACGTTLGSAITAAGGVSEPARAVLVGGYHGTWIAADGADAVRLEDDGLAAHGGSLAAGVIVVLGVSACPVQELAQTLDWLAGQSAKQCGPCSNGLPAIADLVAAIGAGRAPRDAARTLHRWSAAQVGRGACHLPDGAVRFLGAGIRVFAAELTAHARGGACPSCARPITLGYAGVEARVAA